MPSGKCSSHPTSKELCKNQTPLEKSHNAEINRSTGNTTRNRYSTAPEGKVQGTSLKRGQKGCKSQRTRPSAGRKVTPMILQPYGHFNKTQTMTALINMLMKKWEILGGSAPRQRTIDNCR